MCPENKGQSVTIFVNHEKMSYEDEKGQYHYVRVRFEDDFDDVEKFFASLGVKLEMDY